MMQIARGLAKWLADNQTVVPPATWLNTLMEVDIIVGAVIIGAVAIDSIKHRLRRAG